MVFFKNSGKKLKVGEQALVGEGEGPRDESGEECTPKLKSSDHSIKKASNVNLARVSIPKVNSKLSSSKGVMGEGTFE